MADNELFSEPAMRMILTRRILTAAAAIAVGMAATPLSAQWSTVHEQFYLPESHNWAFRQNYNAAERMFYAFDYGHAILYETLWTRPDAAPRLLEEQIYDRLTRRVLVRPPRLPLEEAAIEVEYAKLAPEAKAMFEWAHVLHRQAYDVWADERISGDRKDEKIAQLLAYYISRPEVAFSSRPKSMDLMDGQRYSLAFRERFPKYNGLIWAYHWLQLGLYEPLLVGNSQSERQALVRATVARFWQMLENPPETMPYLMPMTAAIAPRFAERYPEVSIIFDNLHMMHDVISDILASDEVAREHKGAEIRRVGELFRDDTSYVTTVEEWRQMAMGMGVNNQGGPAIGHLGEHPVPTVPRGLSMAGMDAADMDHGAHGPQPVGHAEAEPSPDHHPAGHPAEGDRSGMQQMMEVHERMMADPVIRERAAGDPELQRMLREMPRMRGSPAATSETEMHRAMEFILRLLSDPEVEARIHADPRFHRLWSDPEVQRHLDRMRQMQDTGRGAPTGQPDHQHQ